MRHDLYSNTYNPSWREHPKFSYARANNYQNYQKNSAQAAPQKSNLHLEEMMKSLANTVQSLQQQMGQIATSVSKLESQGKLPSQTEINPKQNASAIMLRSGRELHNVRGDERGLQSQEQVAEENLSESEPRNLFAQIAGQTGR